MAAKIMSDVESGEKQEDSCQSEDETEPSEEEKKMAKYALYIYGLLKLLFWLDFNVLTLLWLYKSELSFFPITEVPQGLLNTCWTFMAWSAIPIHFVAFCRLLMWRQPKRQLCLMPSVIHNILNFPLFLWFLIYYWNVQESPILFWDGLIWIITWILANRLLYKSFKVLLVLQSDMWYYPKPLYCLKFNLKFLDCWVYCDKLKYRKD